MARSKKAVLWLRVAVQPVTLMAWLQWHLDLQFCKLRTADLSLMDVVILYMM